MYFPANEECERISTTHCNKQLSFDMSTPNGKLITRANTRVHVQHRARRRPNRHFPRCSVPLLLRHVARTENRAFKLINLACL